jgi:O-antigen/teichoic acid export membrane protein
MPMAPIVSVLALYALVKSFEVVGSPFFMGTGKPKITTIALFVQCVMMALLLPLFLMKFSTVGAAWAMLGSGFASALVYIIALFREKLLGISGIFRLVIVPFLSGGIMLVSIVVLKLLFPVQNVFLLFSYVGFGGCVYFLALWCADTLGAGDIFQHFRWVRARIFSHRRT